MPQNLRKVNNGISENNLTGYNMHADRKLLWLVKCCVGKHNKVKHKIPLSSAGFEHFVGNGLESV